MHKSCSNKILSLKCEVCITKNKSYCEIVAIVRYNSANTIFFK